MTPTEKDHAQQEARIAKMSPAKQKTMREAIEIEHEIIRLRSLVREQERAFMAKTKRFTPTDRVIAERHALLETLLREKSD